MDPATRYTFTPNADLQTMAMAKDARAFMAQRDKRVGAVLAAHSRTAMTLV